MENNYTEKEEKIVNDDLINETIEQYGDVIFRKKHWSKDAYIDICPGGAYVTSMRGSLKLTTHEDFDRAIQDVECILDAF